MREQYRRLASFADKVTRGIDAGSIPVELPRTFELQVNLATAKAIGLAIPQALLRRADTVIECPQRGDLDTGSRGGGGMKSRREVAGIMPTFQHPILLP